MKITEHEIVAFFIGAVVGAIITYLSLTREKRTISAIRRGVDLLAAYHELSPTQYRKVMHPTQLVTDEQILALYRWAVEACRRLKKESRTRLCAIRLTAETIICEELLGLTRSDALRALISGIQERADLSDIRTRLPKI
jgi:hypothetical protein